MQFIIDNKLIFIGVILSVVIHIGAIKYITIPEKPETPTEEKPIEISVVPKEEKEPTPPPLAPSPTPIPPNEYIEPLPDAETTMDKDVNTAPKIAENTISEPADSNDEKNVQGEDEEKSPTGDTVRDLVDMDDIEKPLELIEEDEKTLADVSDIIERIARQKPPEKPGEDSASYSIFEERYASYFSKFKRNVYQIWKYPDLSVQNNESGVVNVSFSIFKNGRIVNIKLKQTSGYPALDREVIRVLKTMGTVPLPQSYELEQLNVDDAYFIYTLDGRVRGIY